MGSLDATPLSGAAKGLANGTAAIHAIQRAHSARKTAKAAIRLRVGVPFAGLRGPFLRGRRQQ